MAIGTSLLKMSIYYTTFQKRIDKLYRDCELAEYIAINHKLLRDDKKVGFKGAKSARFPLLSQATSASQRSEIVRHLTRTIYAAFIKELYEACCAYLKEVLNRVIELHKITPKRLLGETNFKIKAEELIDLETHEQLVAQLSEKLFREMERREANIKQKGKDSYPILISLLEKRLGISISKKLTTCAEPYLALRHILVHNDGVPDQQFLKKYGSIISIPHNRKKF